MVTIAVLREQKPGEERVAASPDAVKKYIALGAKVVVQSGAGKGSSFADSDYQAAGASIAQTGAEALKDASILLAVNQPETSAIAALGEESLVIGMLAPYANREPLGQYQQKKIAAFALELLPRISRAQAMDVLSSQSNLAGYRAVIEAVAASGKVVPMMMTAAGTIAPSKALILGAGVAGLQAIATARRLGAVVSAFDVRPVAKEQVESLGAKFIEVKADENAETSGGYAKEMSEDYQRRQRELIHETIKKQDIVVSTALIPGRPAPTLITSDMVADMKPGSVIVDIAAASGGNCPLTKLDEIITTANGVIIVGYGNLPGRAAVDASQLYARNLYNFVAGLILNKEGALDVKWDDELVTGTLLTKGGATVHKQFQG